MYEGCGRMLFCNEPPFYAAQLACLLHTVVGANKKVEMQEGRRWKPWVWCGENFEFIAELSPAPDDAKRKAAKTQGPGQGPGTDSIEKMSGCHSGDLSPPRISCRTMLMVSLRISYGPGHCVVLNVCRTRANPRMGYEGRVSAATVVTGAFWRGYDYEPWSNGHSFLSPSSLQDLPLRGMAGSIGWAPR